MSPKLEDLRQSIGRQAFTACRLVHYVGLGEPNAMDVGLDEIESQVSGVLSEGFQVHWNSRGDTLYICVQEPDCPMPPWEMVFCEAGVVDEAAILRAAGFTDAT